MYSSRTVIPYALLFLSSLISASVAQTSVATTAVATTAVSTTTIGQSPSQVTSTTTSSTGAPACANSCVQTALLTQSCAPGNQTCLCSYSTEVQESIHNCLAVQSTCSEAEETQAFEYFPAYCKGLGLAVETNAPTLLATLAGSGSPTATVGVVNAATSSASSSSQQTSSSSSSHQRLQLPAILGIVMAVLVVLVVVGVVVLWSCLRRRQMPHQRGPRTMDLTGEFAETPSHILTQHKNTSSFFTRGKPWPSIEEKDPFGEAFGEALSRSSTLVPPPPVAKDDRNRSSDEKRNSARTKALRVLLGEVGGGRSPGLSSLRAMSSRKPGSSKNNSLAVSLLEIRKEG